MLDGDRVRRELSPELGYSESDRNQHVLRVGYVSSLLAQHGVLVVASLISPFEDARERVRALYASRGIPFYLVHLNATVAQCIQRDPKGLYALALDGASGDFTGLTQRYELPSRPDLVLSTGTITPEATFCELAEFLKAKHLL